MFSQTGLGPSDSKRKQILRSVKIQAYLPAPCLGYVSIKGESSEKMTQARIMTPQETLLKQGDEDLG
jgi:hypothetical protein